MSVIVCVSGYMMVCDFMMSSHCVRLYLTWYNDPVWL